MKININNVRTVPLQVKNFAGFGVCVFGTANKEVKEWISYHGLSEVSNGDFTNILIPEEKSIKDLFLDKEAFEYLDGFSPNLNKKLHIGHFSNLVLAKAFQSLEVSKKNISIVGDTVDGEVDKEDALELFNKYCEMFSLKVDKMYFASAMNLSHEIMIDGDGEYEGTKIFSIGEEKIVGIKSNNSTSYFYQDVSLAQELNAPTLYLTGKEQDGHFKSLKKMFPQIDHIGLGLVKAKGKKMASRTGNVIFIEDVIANLTQTFGDYPELAYNVFAGFILKANPEVDKNIDFDNISNPKNSIGLYLSYTMAKLKSAGLKLEHENYFYSKDVELAYLKSKYNYTPNVLFEAVFSIAKNLSKLYEQYPIKDNPQNHKLYALLLSDLLLGCKKVGLFIIEKV